jgi:hypothetical protein
LRRCPSETVSKKRSRILQDEAGDATVDLLADDVIEECLVFVGPATCSGDRAASTAS